MRFAMFESLASGAGPARLQLALQSSYEHFQLHHQALLVPYRGSIGPGGILLSIFRQGVIAKKLETSDYVGVVDSRCSKCNLGTTLSIVRQK